MVEVWLPYGNTRVPARVKDEHFHGVLEPNLSTDSEALEKAISRPIGGRDLSSLAGPDSRIVMALDQSVLASASVDALLRLLTRELERGGSKTDRFTCLVAREPLVDWNGKLPSFPVAFHDHAASEAVNVGKSKGVPVSLNRKFVEADVRVVISKIEPRLPSGYSGGPFTIVPGLASMETARRTYSSVLNDDGKRTSFVKDLEVARLARVDFAVALVPHPSNGFSAAFTGDFLKSYREAVAFYERSYRLKLGTRPNIVVGSAGGSPYDQTLYTSCLSLDHASRIVEPGGIVIMAAECAGGLGNRTFAQFMKKYESSRQMEASLKRRFVLGGHMAYFLHGALERARVYLTSVLPDAYTKGVFKMRPARTVNAAVHTVEKTMARGAHVSILPNASLMVPP